MGLRIVCDRCGKDIGIEERVNLKIIQPRNDNERILLNQEIYLCEEHRKEFPKIMSRFFSTYMTNKKT